MSAPELPVDVLQRPHWRLLFRPRGHEGERIPTLSECWSLVEKQQVRLRGWYFPHIGSDTERQNGNSYIAAWANFAGFGSHIEYWRFFRSAQFLHLAAVRECDPEWHRALRSRVGRVETDVEVPGFLSITNTIFSITEYFEFAARLCQAQVYTEPFRITVGIHGIKGFALAPDEHAFLHSLYQAKSTISKKIGTFNPSI